MIYAKVFIVSPIREYRTLPGEMLSPGKLRLLAIDLSWVAGRIRKQGSAAIHILDSAGIPDGFDAYRINALLSDPQWKESMRESCRDNVSWCEAVALMPECLEGGSPLVDMVNAMAVQAGRPVVRVEDLLGISGGALRSALVAAESADEERMSFRESRPNRRGGRSSR